MAFLEGLRADRPCKRRGGALSPKSGAIGLKRATLHLKPGPRPPRLLGLGLSFTDLMNSSKALMMGFEGLGFSGFRVFRV